MTVVKKRQEFVFINNFLKDKIEGDVHELGIFHWGVQVEIIDVGEKEACVGL